MQLERSGREAAAWAEMGSVRLPRLKGCACLASGPSERSGGFHTTCEGGQFMPCENAEFRLHLEMVSRLYWRLNSWLFFYA